MQTRQLPEFRAHGDDSKFKPLEETHLKPSADQERHFLFLEQWLQRPLREMTVLDAGCGRGELVAALRGGGVRAFGYDIDARFVSCGGLLNRRFHDEFPVLSVSVRGRTIFPDSFFDLVISDQVLEHVATLPEFASEIARVLKPGGFSAHQFPSRFRPIEPHYFLPFVHWLPKSGVRRATIRALLMLGGGKQFFPEFDLDSRADIIHKYSVEETFYRPLREVEAAFADQGIFSSTRDSMPLYVQLRLSCPRVVASVLAPVAGAFRMAMVTGRKDSAR